MDRSCFWGSPPAADADAAMRSGQATIAESSSGRFWKRREGLTGREWSGRLVLLENSRKWGFALYAERESETVFGQNKTKQRAWDRLTFRPITDHNSKLFLHATIVAHLALKKYSTSTIKENFTKYSYVWEKRCTVVLYTREKGKESSVLALEAIN